MLSVTLPKFGKLINMFSSYTIYFFFLFLLSCWPLWNWKVWVANNVMSSPRRDPFSLRPFEQIVIRLKYDLKSCFVLEFTLYNVFVSINT